MLVGTKDFTTGCAAYPIRARISTERSGGIPYMLRDIDGYDIIGGELVKLPLPQQVPGSYICDPGIKPCKLPDGRLVTFANMDTRAVVYADGVEAAEIGRARFRVPSIPIVYDAGVIVFTTDGPYYIEFLPDVNIGQETIAVGTATRPLGAHRYDLPPSVTMSPWPGMCPWDTSSALTGWVFGGGVTDTGVSGETIEIKYGNAILSDSLIAECPCAVTAGSVSWLLIDIAFRGDDTEYPAAGLFQNDPSIAASGYCIRLRNDTAHVNVRLPRPPEQGIACRYLLSVRELPFDVTYVGLYTDSFYVSGAGREVNLYNAPFSEDFSSLGTWLLPDFQWKGSPLAEYVTDVIDAMPKYVATFSNPNLVADGENFSGWTFTSTGSQSESKLVTSPVYGGVGVSINIDGTRAALPYPKRSISYDRDTWTSPVMAVSPGVHELTWYEHGDGAAWEYCAEVELSPSASPASWTSVRRMALTTKHSYPSAADDPYLGPIGSGLDSLPWFSCSGGWRRRSAQFIVDAATTHVRIAFFNKRKLTSMAGLCIDNVSLYKVVGVGRDVGWCLQQRDSADPLNMSFPQVQYCVARLYKTNVHETHEQLLMTSLPSPPSVGGIHADGWRVPSAQVYATERDMAYPAGFKVGTLLYRRFSVPGSKDGWFAWDTVEFAAPGGTSITDHNTKPTSTGQYPIEAYPDMYADTPPTAASCGVVMGSRLYVNDGAMRGVIAVSSFARVWAFPTTYDDKAPWIVGAVLKGLGGALGSIHCIVSRKADIYVFSETGLWQLEGDNPMEGYQFRQVSTAAADSYKSVQSTDDAIVWRSAAGSVHVLAGWTKQSGAKVADISSNILDLPAWQATDTSAMLSPFRYLLKVGFGAYVLDLSAGAWLVYGSGTYFGPVGSVHIGTDYIHNGSRYKIRAVNGDYPVSEYWHGQVTTNEIELVSEDTGHDVHVSGVVLSVCVVAPCKICVRTITKGAGLWDTVVEVDAVPERTRYWVPINLYGEAGQVILGLPSGVRRVYGLWLEVDKALGVR